MAYLKLQVYYIMLLHYLLSHTLVSCEGEFWMDNCSISNSEVSERYSSNVITENGLHRFMSCTASNESDISWCFSVKDNCKCIKKSLPPDVVHCSPTGKLSILDCYCVTFNTEKDLVEIGKCIYNCNHHKKELIDYIYRNLPKNVSKMNEVMCGNQFNRNGTLCGMCKDGYFPQVYSFNLTCVECPHGGVNWWKFLLSAFLPLTIFYFIVVFFKINTTYSHLHCFIYYSQIISMPQAARVMMLGALNVPKYLPALRYFEVLYGIWNLDFFRAFDLGICLGTDTLQTLSLDLAVGIYPLLLMVLSYVLIDLYDRGFRFLVILWKPFLTFFRLFCRNWEIRTSLIDAYATFFLLLNVKFLSVSFDLLAPVRVYQFSSSKDFSYTWQLYYDASVPYFGEKHLPYAILAIATLFFFVLLPVLILILYPYSCFQKLLNMFPFRWYILHTFVDSFHGCYKNGTEPGTRDCRWFASFFFIMRFSLFFVAGITFTSVYFIIISVVLVIFIILLVNVEPFKENLSRYSGINAVCFLLLAMWHVSIIGIDIASVHSEQDAIEFFLVFMVIICCLSILCVSAIILYWIFRCRKFGFKLIRKVCALRQGYDWWTLE